MLDRDHLIGLAMQKLEEQSVDFFNGTPAGDIIVKGCEVSGYHDPVDAANDFRQAMVEAVIEAIFNEMRRVFAPTLSELSRSHAPSNSTWNRECVVCGHKWLGADDDNCPKCEARTNP